MAFFFNNDKGKVNVSANLPAQVSTLETMLGDMQFVVKHASAAAGGVAGSVDFYLTANTRAFMIVQGANSNANGIVMVSTNSSGAVSTYTLIGASNQHFYSTAVDRLTCENTTSAAVYYVLCVFQGEASPT